MLKKLIFDFLELLFIGVAVFIFFWFFLAEPMEVTGSSMEPTLLDKEQLITEKISIKYKGVKRGDIVVFKEPKEQKRLVIKRVVGLPNESFMIKGNKVYINGKKLNESYLAEGTVTESKTMFENGAETIIPDETYILLGDNRENSFDSRDIGPINKNLLVGKALFVYHPTENLRFLNNVNLFFLSSVVNKFDNALNF